MWSFSFGQLNQFYAIHHRHADIHDEEIEVAFKDRLPSFSPSSCFCNVVADFFQCAAKNLACCGVIFRNQNGWREWDWLLFFYHLCIDTTSDNRRSAFEGDFR